MHPLSRPGAQDAELEALQTDVMRFVAILGLCLAAIFSLVQSAAVEQQRVPRPPLAAALPEAAQPSHLRPPPPAAAEITSTPVALATTAVKQPDQQPVAQSPPAAASTVARATASVAVAAEAPAPSASAESGYTLEFDSTRALLALLSAGTVQVIARLDGRVWVSRDKPLFVQAEAPSSYYRMDAGTVPDALVQALRNVAGAAEPEWGVVLPASLQEQLRGYAARPGGGVLVIEADASLHLESARGQATSTR
jgi:hypothetical protein